MAIYRQVYIDFWQDNFVTELSAEDRYFYLYLMTNSKTSQCGVYQINIKLAALELGWDTGQVEKLIERFEAYGKIQYNKEHNEIMIMNWLKYNKASSPKVAKAVDKELKEIKTDAFLDEVVELCDLYGYPIDTVSIRTRNKNKNKNKNNNKNNNKNENEEPENMETLSVSQSDNKEVGFGEVITFFEQNIAPITPHRGDDIGSMCDVYGADLVLHAFKTGVTQGNSGMSYIKGILRNWKEKNYTSSEQVEAARMRHSLQQKQKKVENVPEWFGKPETPQVDVLTPEQEEEKRQLEAEIAAMGARRHA